ncbi:HVA22-like protein a [Zostera marina]|uniref:HVA22-like protein n=1 Tax=Zostera marina TaxID=29655 RepID=A0A0K9NJ55_ZOSMR|nr:HVA22-like protein a [Zostera marina]
MITLVYPLYASITAIESKSPSANQQWLTYWVLYSLITLTELTFARFLQWIPFLYYAKFVGTCWLVLPYFSGATYVYDSYVRPFVMNQKPITMSGNILKPSDMLRVAEEYIAENGPRVFKMLADRTGNLTNTGSSSRRRRLSLLEEMQVDQDARLRRSRENSSHYNYHNHYSHIFDDNFRY